MPYHYSFDENRTFGCEFECVIRAGKTRRMIHDALVAAGVQVRDLNGYSHTRDNGGLWEMKTDCSIHTDNPGEEGMEIVSPILKGFAGIEKIEKVCTILTQFCRVNKSCGFHVHHGVPDLFDSNFRSLYRAAHADAEVMNQLVPPSRRNNRYCQPLPAMNLPATNVPSHVSRRLGRYCAVNFASFIVRGTIEFRQHSATIEGKKAVAWIVFTQSMISWAKEFPDARPKAQQYDRFSDGPMGVLYRRYGMRANETFEGKQYKFLRRRWNKFNLPDGAVSAEEAEIAAENAAVAAPF
jgi:hypothetical protein